MPRFGSIRRSAITRSIGVLIPAAAFLAAPASGIAQEEELGFTAEHMIEAQMDARYLALPEIEMRTDDRVTRFDVGYMAASGGLTASSAAMLGLQTFRPWSSDGRWGLVLGGFLDLIRFDGSRGNVTLDPTFTDALPVGVPIDAEVLEISGDALHVGLSIAAARRISERWAWQAGVVLEYYDIDAFKVNFRAGGPNGFDGLVDYAANYNAVTPYLSFQHVYPRRSDRFVLSSRFLVAWPLPHRGFYGRIAGPGFNIEGDTETAGHGQHIPDAFAGIGFDIESTQHRWRLDVGASLWLLLVENKGHEGVDPPLFLHFNMPLG